MERNRNELRVGHPKCPYCHDAVAPEQEKVACPACMTWQHRECWSSHGQCSACGGTSTAPLASMLPHEAVQRRGRACSRSGCSEQVVFKDRGFCAKHALAWARRNVVISAVAIPGCLLCASLFGSALGDTIQGYGSIAMFFGFAGLFVYGVVYSRAMVKRFHEMSLEQDTDAD